MVPSPRDPNPAFAMFYPGLGSWLLSKLQFTSSSIKTTAIVLSVIATIGFISTGLALFDVIVPFVWWRALAIVSAVVSLFLLIVFWDKVLIVGLGIDFAVLMILLFTRLSPV